MKNTIVAFSLCLAVVAAFAMTAPVAGQESQPPRDKDVLTDRLPRAGYRSERVHPREREGRSARRRQKGRTYVLTTGARPFRFASTSITKSG